MEKALRGGKDPTMDKELDARGQQCPIPVVRAKSALKEIDTGTVVVRVDNSTSVENLTNLAKTMNCEVSHEKLADDDFKVSIVKTEDSKSESDYDPGCAVPVQANRVVAFSCKTMGTGDDELGAILMKGFIFALTQQDVLPQTMLFYNSGVFLTCEGSESLEDLRTLEESGVEILTCGTCLNHYDITDKLQVGSVTNLYVTAEKQMNATVIIRP